MNNSKTTTTGGKNNKTTKMGSLQLHDQMFESRQRGRVQKLIILLIFLSYLADDCGSRVRYRFKSVVANSLTTCSNREGPIIVPGPGP